MGPEIRHSFIDRARNYLGLERSSSRWEYSGVGAGLKLAAAAEGA